MKLYSAGDKSKAICQSCQDVVETTFLYRDVPFDDGTGVVKDILASVCDHCGEVVAIPAQSLPAIRRAQKNVEVSLEAQVPASDIEVLDAAATRISERASKRHRKLLLAFYVRKMSQNPQARERLKQLFSEAKAAKPKVNVKIPRKRLSFKVSRNFEKEFTELTKISGLKKTQVLRGVVQEIRSDLVYPENPVSLPQLREMVATLES
ncbi:hypothetical protein [Sulfitobacter sp. M22]|jgi:hypothetical protein|uniref:hypothetical protein n=1 Tax=unclassified Sulfitobacter TaxID=196795 RepID=UPI000C0CAD32|nr:hypothetical protein [Sulfitobacter sp. M22]MBA96176.1 hypothetical protein [Roseobacter sp.]MBV49883.1 hypothetical protein [Roseobacter sp.]MCF7728720.1 hypothetical protein [Sulfitobacter sp. M22]PHR08117.1 MAG: hypothetical protein COB29_07860 [Sulfitobacter sp.]|tara:strand:- start:296 stop:916 length:621 start_codon:yes stop_codon:yes gene_type:complete